MMKRAGCGHNHAMVSFDSEGCLVMECPACPIPGKNMPDDWAERFKDQP